MLNKINVPVLSFYSGGGFLDIGFEKAGFEIIWTNEIDKVFAELHSSGVTSWRKAQGNGIKAEIFNTTSITEISSEQIISEAFPSGKPEIFGIIGGPPCQDFSVNGSLEGFNGEKGKLTTIFFDKILELKPTFFVMENVPGLTKRKTTQIHLNTLLFKLSKLYFVDHETLNALEFGVPQFRERVFFVGIRKDTIVEDTIIINTSAGWFNWPKPIYKNAAKKYKWPKLSLFGNHQVKPKGIPYKLCVESCLIPLNKTESVCNANEYFNLTYKTKLRAIKEGDTNRPSFKRLHRYRYSPTACYGNNEVHLHPYINRRLSVREALNIQGVPESYVLPPDLPLSKKFKLIGNGVPVPLAEAVAQALKLFMIENKLIIDNYGYLDKEKA